MITHKHILDKSNPALCACGIVLTVSHLFENCPQFASKGASFKISFESLSNENEQENILEYLKSINIHEKI